MSHLTLVQPASNPLDVFDFEGNQVRTLSVAGDPWFVANDVSVALEYRDADKLTRMLDDDEKGTHNVGTLGGAQEMLVINESGLYSAILRSRKPEAKRFKKWVTSVLLPGIRKKEFVHASEAQASGVNMGFVMREIAELKEMMRYLAAPRQDQAAALPAPVASEYLSRASVKSLGLLSTCQLAKKLGLSTSRLNAIFEVLEMHTRVTNRYTLTSKGIRFSLKVGMVNTVRGGPKDKYLWKPDVVGAIPKHYLP